MKIELFNDNFQNFKAYDIPAKAQLVIADIPYNIGTDAYGSNPLWYIGGDNSNGESSLAAKSFFKSDGNFNIAEFFHFSSKLLKKEPKETNKAPAMIVFCSWQQIPIVQSYGERHGFKKSFPIYFIKNSSPQVLKAKMKILGAVETALVLYRDKLPKFNGMVLNRFNWTCDGKNIPRIHPTPKPVKVLKQLIQVFTDVGDLVIDPVAGSASTLRVCAELNRSCYGFEVDKKFFAEAKSKMFNGIMLDLFL